MGSLADFDNGDKLPSPMSPVASKNNFLTGDASNQDSPFAFESMFDNSNHLGYLSNNDELPGHTSASMSQHRNPAVSASFDAGYGQFGDPYSQAMTALNVSNHMDGMSMSRSNQASFLPANAALMAEPSALQASTVSSPESMMSWNALRSPESDDSGFSSQTQTSYPLADTSITPHDIVAAPQPLKPKPKPTAISTTFEATDNESTSPTDTIYTMSPPPSATSTADGHEQHQRPTARRGRKRTTTTDTDPTRARQLERNRRAASRCRKKQKRWIQDLEDSAREGQQRNQELKQQLRRLSCEVVGLREGLLEHSHCEDGRIGKFFEGEVGRLIGDAKAKVENGVDGQGSG